MPSSGKKPSDSTTTSGLPLIPSIGRSVENREILVAAPVPIPALKPGGMLLIAGLHGDERATVQVLHAFVERFLRSGPLASGNIAAIPLANPDGNLPYDPEQPRPTVLPPDHLEILRRSWTTDPSRYIAAVEGPIHKMLAAACHAVLPQAQCL